MVIDRAGDAGPMEENFFLRNLKSGLSNTFAKPITVIPLLYLCFVILLGTFGEFLAPYPYDEALYGQDGQLLRAVSPSLAHPLGTTASGYDVLSRLIIGSQPTALTGLIGGSMIISIGLAIGVTAGYVGGVVDNVLMRVTDTAYSIPLIPFAIVLVAFAGTGFFMSIFVIGLLLWRGNARVLRAQVLQIKNREYITAAKALGASDVRIVVRHILPNIGSMAMLFFALGMGYAIIIQAGLAFLGVTNPFVPSWGVMIRNAYNTGYVASQPGWSVAPGLMISFTVLSAFLLGREYESVKTNVDAASVE
jgi:peptide/nickel transport system permease protein